MNHPRNLANQPGRGAWLKRVQVRAAHCLTVAEAVAGSGGVVDFTDLARRTGSTVAELFAQLDRLEAAQLVTVLDDGTIRRAHGDNRHSRPDGRDRLEHARHRG
jgi:hypothetical protein